MSKGGDDIMVKIVRIEKVDVSKLNPVVDNVELLIKDLLDLKDEVTSVIHSKSASKYAAKLMFNKETVDRIRALILKSEVHSANLKKCSNEALATLEASLAEL